MKLNLSQVAFSMARSYVALSDLPEDYRWEGNPAGLFLRTVRGGAKSTLICRLAPLFENVETPYTCEATADELVMRTEQGALRLCFADELTLLVSGEGAGLGLRLDFYPAKPFFDYLYEIPGADHTRYMANCFGQNVQFLMWAQTGGASMEQTWEGCVANDCVMQFNGADSDGFLAVIREVHTEWDGVCQSYDYEASRARTAENFAAFCRGMPTVPKRYTGAAEFAAYVNWSAIVAKSGFLPRDTMYMSKNWMHNVWSWDNCFNAVALAYANPTAAWDQWMIPFDLQDATGLLPDTTNDSRLDWNYCKPPVHGWALARMMKVMALSEAQLAEAYDKMAKWTNWWLDYRDTDRDGICEYIHGYDSGWDNATTFAGMPPVELPDLQAFLIVQMDVLADLAERLGRHAGAAHWKAQADKMLAAMLAHCFRDGRPVAVHAGSHAVIPTRCLLLYLPVLLGDRLPGDIRAHLVETLKSDAFLTEHGFATESPDSPFYDPDGYWRGPIWAPAMMLLIDGLAACGEGDFAREIAERFCRTMQQNGFAENFDALTGQGLRDLAYTWTPSVFFTLAHDYLQDGRDL